MKEKIVLTHRARRAAKRLVKKQPHQTRPLTSDDYKALPKGGE